jgi:uncharacterized protein (UPF0333 family)
MEWSLLFVAAVLAAAAVVTAHVFGQRRDQADTPSQLSRSIAAEEARQTVAADAEAAREAAEDLSLGQRPRA